MTDDWRAGWDDQDANSLDASLAATPQQRLEWLEEAIELAWAVGALPALPEPLKAEPVAGVGLTDKNELLEIE